MDKDIVDEVSHGLKHPLRVQRELRGWSQRRVAEELQQLFPGVAVSEKEVGRWERHKRNPSPYYREKLCTLFGMDAEQLGLLDAELPMNPGPVTRLTQEQVEELLPLLELGEQDMAYFDASKRQALKTLLQVAGVQAFSSALRLDPWERLMTGHASSMDEQAFTHFQHLMRECWELGKQQLSTAENVLAGFLPDMMRLAPDTPRAAVLAAQGLRLKSILSAHQLHLTRKRDLCLQAVDYAKQTDDADTLVSALTELGVAYKYAGQFDASLQTYQQALLSASEASPLLQTRVYAALAPALAGFGRRKEAEFYINYAYEKFPDVPENDPTFTYADSGIYMLSFYEGLMYLELQQPEEADHAFERYKTYRSSSTTPERNRLEIVNQRGKAAILAKNLDLYVQCLEEGVRGAIALKSKKRFDEVLGIFQTMVPTSWLHEPQIKHLVEHYSLPLREA